MYTDVKYAQIMCEYVRASCLEVLWEETLSRSILESKEVRSAC